MGMVSATENSTVDDLAMEDGLIDEIDVNEDLLENPSEDDLLDSSSNDLLEKGKQKTVITFEEREKYYVGSTISFQLKSSSGKVLSDKYVDITSNNDKMNVTTDDEGKIYLDIINPVEISLSVSFNGDSQYYSSSLSKTITALSTIKMDKLTKIYNGAIEYTSTFYDTEGNLLKNSEIFFQVDSRLYSRTTNNNGVATVIVPIKNGNHMIYAYNPVSDESAGKSVKVFNRISGNKNLNVYFGSGTYKIRVFDDNGNPVKAGEKVTIKIDNKKYVVKTDKKGYAKLKITSQPGKYSISASYKGFEVKNSLKVKPILIPKSFNIKKLGKTFKISAKLLNGKGKPAAGKKITVKFNGKKYKAKTNKKGIAKFTVKTPRKLGDYKIKYSYGKANASLTGTLYRH